MPSDISLSMSMSSINGPAGYTIKQRNRGLFGGECCQLSVTVSHAGHCHCHVIPVTSMSLVVILRYKILFLDVLFPLNVKKIIFVDADQVSDII